MIIDEINCKIRDTWTKNNFVLILIQNNFVLNRARVWFGLTVFGGDYLHKFSDLVNSNEEKSHKNLLDICIYIQFYSKLDLKSIKNRFSSEKEKFM